ncbi:hypothetical protein [Ferrimonas senticii]|uniref:hypothetical protein n=1 Tax=Ferrimonas senticii TaxID=394566 RepID=UPI000425298C|nr:hypothetical protein [Ferrimonas senticii]
MKLLRLTLLTLLILALLLVASIISFSIGMAQFESAQPQFSWLQWGCDAVVGLLTWPTRWLWTPWASTHLPNSFEWLLLLVNCGLWALLINCAAHWVTRGASR